VRLLEQRSSKRFAIEAGAFSARVAKLGPGERFVVTTPDAEVEVRGTVFRVSVVAPDPSCGAGTPTRLEVSEGVVVIRHDGAELSVEAGSHWPDCGASGAPSGATAVTPPSLPTAPSAGPAAVPGEPSVSARVAAAPPMPAPPSTARPSDATPRPSAESRLAEQNDLFDRAMREKRAGRAEEALALLERLRARHPEGPLAESAEVERMRLLTGPARSRAAQAYLERWPRGFARGEAETLAGAP
jgi:hypothetical protein